MDKIPLYFLFNKSSPKVPFLRRVKELFGIDQEDLLINTFCQDNYEALSFKVYSFPQYRVEQELLEAMIGFFTTIPLEDKPEPIDKPFSFFSTYVLDPECFTPEDVDWDIKTLGYPKSLPFTFCEEFKRYLRSRNKRNLLARTYFYEDRTWDGKFSFSLPFDWDIMVSMIPSIVKKDYEDYADFEGTITTIYGMLNSILTRLTLSGKYVCKMKVSEDPITLAETDSLSKEKDLSSLLPYAEWSEGILIGNLRGINIYQYIGPSKEEFLAHWKTLLPEEGDKPKKKRPKFFEPSIPKEKEKALELYSKLREYPSSPADFSARTNKIWKKKAWIRFPIEREFLHAIGSFIDLKFLINSPYQPEEGYDSQKLLSSFTGFRWDHKTLEEIYRKDSEMEYLEVRDWLKDHFCSGNQETYSFLEKWITFVNCYPNRKVSVATALRGGNGLTKTFFGHLMSLNFGSHSLSIIDANLLFGNFTTHRLSTSCFVVLEEAKLTGTHYSKFKDSVTGGSTIVNHKYDKIMEIIVLAAYLIITNNNHYYQCDLDDRRVFGLDFDNSWFKERAIKEFNTASRWKESVDSFTEGIKKDNYRKWRLYLGYLYSEVRPLIENLPTLVALRPNTKALDKQKLLSANGNIHWWIQCVKQHSYITPEYFRDSTPYSRDYQGIPFAPTPTTLRDSSGDLVPGRRLREEVWDEEWLTVVHYLDLYESYKTYRNQNKKKGDQIMNANKWISSFFQDFPQDLREQTESLSKDNPFIRFGSWRNHYLALLEMGWPISSTL